MDFISSRGIVDPPADDKQTAHRNMASALGMVINQAIRMEAGQAGRFALIVYDHGAPETATCISNDMRTNTAEVLRLSADRMDRGGRMTPTEGGAQ